MSAKKQTAVEWLVQQIFGDHTSQWQKEIDQAKAMEKEQIIDAWYDGRQSYLKDTSEQYYDETYGKA